MGTVYKKTYTKPLPAGAELFIRKGERFAKWKDRKGKTRTAAVTTGQDGTDRLLLESPYYIAKYRDGAGLVQETATGCRDEQAARRILADLERRAELVKAGVMTTAETRIADHQATPLAEHLAAFGEYGVAAGHSAERRANVGRQLERLAVECSFGTLADLRRDALERWLAAQSREGMGARTRNTYRGALVSFGNWCAETGRLAANPFVLVPKADERADPRRRRRALNEAELIQLLDVARRRPLLDALTVRKGPRKGELYAEVRDGLERLGRERALIYKTLVLTGLRKGELESLTVVKLYLDGPDAFAELDSADEKNREGNTLPLRADLAADLRDWLADKLARLQADARQTGEPIPARLPPDTPLFNVPEKLCKILARDLRLAGIAKRDDRGRVLDVHALRHTFGTLMSKGGVTPRTVQAAMRHSKIDLTMSVYTDPRLLDVWGALDALPALPLDGAERGAVAATGTEGETARTLAPLLALTRCKLVQAESTAGNSEAGKDTMTPGAAAGKIAGKSTPDKRKGPLTFSVSSPLGVGATGFEPVTPSVSSWCSSQLS